MFPPHITIRRKKSKKVKQKQMANKWDLTTAVASLTGSTAGTGLGLGAVAQGKKRFVTYIKIECRAGANTVDLGEAAASTGVISTTKFSEYVNTKYEYPEKPGDVDHPLFKIGTPAHLGAVTGSGGDGDSIVLTLQYYDE